MLHPLEGRHPQTFAGDLLAIPREFGTIENFFREMETQPRPPSADFSAGTSRHPACQMLEMADGISEVAVVASGGGGEDPDQCSVGRGLSFQDGFVAL